MYEMNGKYTTAKIMIDYVEEACTSQIIGFLNHPVFTNPIAIMPDTHAGKGSVVGFTMPMTEKIIPNVIGVDIGCFIGETKVELADNRKLNFLDLIKEQEEGKENFCFAKDPLGNIIITKILSIFFTKIVTKLVKIILDNDEIIYCTEDHIFFLLNQKEIEAKNLEAGVSLFPLYIKKAKQVKNISTKSNYLKNTDYLVVYNPKTNKYDYVHCLADDYNTRKNVQNSLKIFVRHHKNFNKFDNNPTNLERVSWPTHWKIHADHASELNKQGKSGWKISWQRHYDKFRKMSSKKMKKLSKNSEFQKKRNAASAENFRVYCQTEKFKEQSKTAGQRGKVSFVRYNKSIKGKEKSKEIAHRTYICPICNKKITSPIAVNAHRKKHEGLTFQEFKQIKNHKIKSIETISCEPTKVYCLRVEEHSNFALSAGVFVHNCGMRTFNIGSNLSLPLQELDHKIRQRIPFGFDINEKSVIDFVKEFPWKQTNVAAQKFAIAYQEKFKTRISLPHFDFLWFEQKCKSIGCDLGRAIKSLCSLGGGNHFIELGLSTNNHYWLTIHTGSRNFGKCICEYWQDIAIKKLKRTGRDDRKTEIANLKLTLKGKELFDAIKAVKGKAPVTLSFSDDLCYLDGEDAQTYLFDMVFAQIYAQTNRELISRKIIEILKTEPVDTIETVHNFIDFEDFIIRKGAIRSYENERMIIPFNMRDGILVCTGKSNPEWNFSAPHGAGRFMSRAQAKKTLKLDDFETQMKGIFSTSVNMSTLDEAPNAYKNPMIIEEAIGPTANIIDRLKPIMNMKDSKGTDN